MAKSAPTQLSIFDLPILSDFNKSISSPGSGVGAKHYVSRGGQLIALSGRPLARANRSAKRAKGSGKQTPATSGQKPGASSPLADPLSCWENKLHERLGMDGSMEYELTWRRKVTPAGHSISQLSRLEPRIFVSGSIGVPSTWPTPTKADGDGGHGMGQASATGRRPNGTKVTVSLPGVVKIITTWPTPNSTVVEAKSRPPVMEGRKASDPQISTADVAVHLYATTWPTPRASDHKNGNGKTGNRTPEASHKAGWTLSEIARSGPTPSGSKDQIERLGALNPAFPCWLMGFPDEWDA